MAQRRYRLIRNALAFALVVLLVNGCAAIAPQGPAQDRNTGAGDVGRPSPPPASMGPAGTTLLMQGRAQREAGKTAQASSTLERAIRIEPGQPLLWLELARVRMQEGNYAQAGQLAKKAASVSTRDASLRTQIDELIAESRHRQGLRSPLE